MRFVVCLAACAALAQTAADPIIESARTAAASYSKALPDYIVTRTTSRLRGTRPASYSYINQTAISSYSGMAVPGWQRVDTVAASVAAEHGSEVLSNISVDGKPVPALPAGGIWSAGEFSGLLLEVLAPQRAAVFTHARSDKLRNISARRYDFEIDQKHSQWRLESGARGKDSQARYSPAFKGAIWIDPATGGVLRIERTAEEMPLNFPLDGIRSETDYDYISIGEVKFLLPVRSETITCARDSSLCLKNQTVFENYSKFETNSSISFDAKPEPK